MSYLESRLPAVHELFIPSVSSNWRAIGRYSEAISYAVSSLPPLATAIIYARVYVRKGRFR
jgi:hypothetical protein